MKRIVLIAILTLSFGTLVYAQNSAKGIKGGLNFSSLSTDGNDDKNLKMGFHAGVFTKIPFSESFAVQPELLYSGKGIKLNYDENAFADGETKFNLNYIDVPVKLVFNLSEDFEFQFGPYVSYLINANTDTDAEFFGGEYNSSDEMDGDHFNTIDYGLTAGLGFDLDPMIFGLNYNLGLNPVAKDDDISHDLLGDAKNMVIQVYVGLKF
ncbi:outer membrane beta-barrel protein [Maribellus comscasis]|uniref:Outer membrane beta-barrel protein n=1 Tax=Maribellus comscasis TaxID=2681766 RepID=A0A6I6KBQ2_9BACT|nr:porin family protein [Maribellus comscasis]QGY47674.1 outer membrane beta-barrel protein [Maribellus comscasis]